MKAAVFYGKGDIKIEERPMPKAGPGQMVVKIEYCGVCGTDMEAYKYEIVKPVIVLGHENIGTVYEVGDGVEGFKVGDKVLCGPPSYCEEGCPSCRSGRPNICSYGFPRTNGIGGPDGGFSEYMLVADPAHTMVIHVPEGVNPKDAVLFDVICVSLHALRKSNFKFGDTVAVSGTGPIGLAAIQIAKAAGARRVIAIGTNPAKEELLKKYGADCCIFTSTCEDLGAAVREACGSGCEGADVTLECSGAQDSLINCAYGVAKPGSQIVLVGIIGEPLSKLNVAGVISREIDFISSFVYTPEEIEIYLDMLASGKISFPGMVTDIVSLDDVVEKAVARKDRKGMLKILMDP
ncbi:MAG: alcohol dehydrogenase catalytic domain-containing protein, partial [Parasporobacterium sp.]|nr:alcohol dehydrogenase catalytic domain-containing protein [Parasporobacterium sp.]